MLRFALTILTVALCFILNAQKYPFVVYGTEQGLPQSQVTSFTQDHKGYLWIGTFGGLAKFGGSKFITFSSDDGLLNNRVTALDFFDNTVWVGHDGGISYIKNNVIKQVGFEGTGNDRSRNVSDIIQFNNKIYVCSNGGGLFTLQDERLIKLDLGDEVFDKVREAYVLDDQLLLATKGGVLESINGTSFKLSKKYDSVSYSGITGNHEWLVTSTFRNGVSIENLKTGQSKVYSQEILRHSVYGAYIDQRERIWLSTLHGVVLIEQNGQLKFFDDSNGLPLNMISKVFNDNAGNIWIGSQGKGMFRFPSEEFRYYDSSTGFLSDLFLGGFQDKNGDYYFSTFDKGVIKMDVNGQVKPVIDQDIAVWAALPDVDGKHWFGTVGYLAEVDQTGYVVRHYVEENSDIPGWKITALYKINSNSMFIGGNGGVAIYESGVFKKLGSGANSDIGTVRDFELVGDTLFCVSNLGVFTYLNGKFNQYGNIDDVVYSLERDKFGALWYGTEEGLFRIKKGEVRRFQLLKDPGSNFIPFINHKDGRLFIGTNNGLFVASDLDKEKLKLERYGIRDGVIDLETNQNSGFFDNSGNLWFGTASGLISYHPSYEKSVLAKPKVNFLNILLNYEPFDYSLFAEELDADGFPVSLELPYSRNNLIFELDGVALAHQKELSYQFILEGLNEDWSPLSPSPTITFTSLPAGDYILKVRAVDLEGGMSDELSFPFTINAPFYRTWWFVSCCVLFAVLVFVLIFRFRIRRLAEVNKQERLMYKSRLLTLEQRSLNASMNRHFIFNALNSIQYFINTEDRNSANKYLTNFAKLIRKNLDSATGGNVISLEEELERIELYLSLESMRFKGRFEYNIELNGIDIEPIKIPPMLMQPFIENSIIHGILPDESKKGIINVDLSTEGEFLLIRIYDNGIGIDQSLSRKFDTDGDHRSQGMEITSKRIELLQKMSNYGISLEGPREIADENGIINGTYVLIKIPLSNLDL